MCSIFLMFASSSIIEKQKGTPDEDIALHLAKKSMKNRKLGVEAYLNGRGTRLPLKIYMQERRKDYGRINKYTEISFAECTFLAYANSYMLMHR